MTSTAATATTYARRVRLESTNRHRIDEALVRSAGDGILRHLVQHGTTARTRNLARRELAARAGS